MENTIDDSEEVRLNFLYNSFLTKRFRSLEEIDPFAEVFKCRYVRKSFNDSIWHNSGGIDWIDPLETDTNGMSKVMEDLLDDSIIFSAEYMDLHNIPNFFFSNLSQLYFDVNLNECKTAFSYITNSPDSQLFLDLALLPANYYLHSIGSPIVLGEELEYFREVGLPLTHYPVYRI